MTTRQALTELAREQGWEVGDFPWHAGVAKTGFIRGSVQIRVEWNAAGNITYALRTAPGQPQIVIDRTDCGKRNTIEEWLTDIEALGGDGLVRR